MISRVADHCFWLGRYLERTETTARLLSVTRNLSFDGNLTPLQCWLPVLIVSGEEPRFVERFGIETASEGEAVERDMTWSDDNPASLRRSVNAARENARSIREVISLEVWEAINELYLWTNGRAGQSEYGADRHGFYRHVRLSCQLVSGLLRSTMLHEPPLNFIRFGKLLERVGQTSRVVDVHHHALTLVEKSHKVVETALWLALLRACSGFEPFMKRSQGRVTGDAVADFLVFEPLFPKSVVYGVHAAYSRFARIRPPAERDLPGGVTLERLRALDAWLARSAAARSPEGMHDLLTHVVDETSGICDTVGREMFGYETATESAQ